MTNGDITAGLGLGCWEIGGMGISEPDYEGAARLVRKAYDLGIRHFDTALDYGEGASEEILGRALSHRREDLVLASKVAATGRIEVKRAIDLSCRRMATDYIDIYYIHWPKSGFDLRPMMEGLEDARREGKIRFIGVSNFSVSDMEQVGQVGRIDAHQLCYNLLWRYPERDVIPYCIDHGIKIITFSTIAQGLLSDKVRAPETFEAGDARAATLYYRSDVWPALRPEVERLQGFARSASRPLSALALQWVLSRNGVHGALVGARSAAQIQHNIEAAAGSLPETVARELTLLSDAAMKRVPDEGNIFLYYP